MLSTKQINRYLLGFNDLSKIRQKIILKEIYQNAGMEGLYYVEEKTGIKFKQIFNLRKSKRKGGR